MLRPKWILHAEGGAALAAALFAYSRLHGGWGWFALLLLTPDIFMLGYLVNVRAGAATYNLAHTYILPLTLCVGFLLSHHTYLLWLPVIWVAHIGLDRMLGYGLKYPTTFQDTHLEHV